MNTLFCPTVGPILSGDSPGVSLYNVLILSRRVYSILASECNLPKKTVGVTCAERTVLPAPSNPTIMTENSSFLKFNQRFCDKI